MKFCLVRNCNNSSLTTPDKKFFALPHNNTLRKLWLEAVSYRGPLRFYNMYVCQDHFDLQNDLDHRYPDIRILKIDAIPQIVKQSTNPRIAAEHQNITANNNNLNANAIPKEKNEQETDNMDDAFSLFVKSVIAHLKQMPVQPRLRVRNKIENIMKRGSVLNL